MSRFCFVPFLVSAEISEKRDVFTTFAAAQAKLGDRIGDPGEIFPAGQEALGGATAPFGQREGFDTRFIILPNLRQFAEDTASAFHMNPFNFSLLQTAVRVHTQMLSGAGKSPVRGQDKGTRI
jgi:hypothetical protein